MKIALCQTNPVIGDIAYNMDSITNMINAASNAGADMAVFPEYALCGYAPDGFNFFPGLIDRCVEASHAIAGLTSIPVILGSLSAGIGGSLAESTILVIEEGTVRCQPAGHGGNISPGTFMIKGKKIQVTTGNGPVPANFNADIILRLSSLPYTANTLKKHREDLSREARARSSHVIFMNQGGGQGEYVCYGGSLLLDTSGRPVARCALFREEMVLADTENTGISIADENELELLHMALVAGIRDYAKKTGFSKAVIGLSGGIDSALVACLACDALGKESVLGISMPSPFSSSGSVDDSRILADNLGITLETIPISRLYNTFREELKPVFRDLPEGLAEENIQARVRGTILMSVSNKTGAMVLATGNKSELAMGYCTLYGDMCGSLAVISDLYKMDVYALSRYINRGREIIPAAILEKAPSAELRENQKDEDSLPPYPVLDAILERYLDRGMNLQEIISDGCDPEVTRNVINQVMSNEFKRRQAAPGLRISTAALGIDRRYPVLHRYMV